MAYKITSAKITSESDEALWGGCFAENGFFVVLETAGKGDLSAAVAGKTILDILLLSFSNQKERTAQSLENIVGDIKDWSQVKSLVVGLIDENNIHLKSYKDAEAVLKREGKFGKILSSDDSSSGVIMENDAILISSETFRGLKWEYKERMFLSPDPERAVESVAAFIMDGKMKGASALYISVNRFEEEKFPVPEIESRNDSRRKKLLGRLRALYPSKFNPGFENKSKRLLIAAATVIFILFIISIAVNMGKNRSTFRQEKLNKTLELVSHQYDEAVNLIDLNPVRSRTLLSAGKLSLTPLLKEFPKNSEEYKSVEDWIGKVSEAEVKAYKIFRLTAVPLFFDLNLIKTGGLISKTDSFKDDIAILDETNKSVYLLSKSSKKASIMAGPDTVDNARTVTLYGDFIYLVNSKGIVRVDTDTKKPEVAVEADPEWGEIVSADAYGGNIYLLDRGKNAIWKYMTTENGFSDRYSYLNSDTRADFSQSMRMDIDGSVWVVRPDAILRFSRGLSDPFSVKDFSDTLTDIVSASVSDDNRNIYILDKNLSRILVFSKDGEYQSQYQWDELKDATDISASEKDKKIFVFIQGRIYAVEIK